MTLLLYPIQTINEIVDFTHYTNLIFQWFERNQLILNESKCELINFYLNKNILSSINYIDINNQHFVILS